MAKSILQEVATLNAQMFNEAKLKSDIQGLTDNVDRYYVQIEQLAYKLENDYKVIVAKLLEETTNSNEILRAEMTQLDINVNSLQRFTVDELAKYFYDSGSMKKEYRRADVKINESIDQLQLKPLEYFTGPITAPTYDGEGIQNGYEPENNVTERDWVYIKDSKLMYAEYSFVALGTVDGKNTVTIGDVTRYSNAYFPGTVKIQNDTDIANGNLTINTPATTDDSINVNKNIVSDYGFLKVQVGVETTTGDIKTGTGNIKTDNGDINSKSGRFFIGTGDIKNNSGVPLQPVDVPSDSGGLQGFLYANLGFVSNTGGFVNLGTGNISTGNGDIKTDSGSVECTSDITTNNGNISITSSGNFFANNGDIYANFGSIYTNNGDLKSENGDLLLSSGGIIVSNNILSTDGNLTLTTGDATIGGDATVSSDMFITGDTEMTGDLWVKSDLEVTGKSEFNDDITVNADFEAANLSTDGDLTVGGSGDFTGSLKSGNLDVTGTGDFTGNVEAANFKTDGFFYGTATKALYADLAEKYESDVKYVPGTVLSIGIDTEVTLYDKDLPYAGIVSSDPAFLMNDKSENSDYVDVALKGRVPVLTHQDITRGMYIVPDLKYPGYCKGLSKQEFDKQELPLIGICINSSKNGYVEVKI